MLPSRQIDYCKLFIHSHNHPQNNFDARVSRIDPLLHTRLCHYTYIIYAYLLHRHNQRGWSVSGRGPKHTKTDFTENVVKSILPSFPMFEYYYVEVYTMTQQSNVPVIKDDPYYLIIGVIMTNIRGDIK